MHYFCWYLWLDAANVFIALKSLNKRCLIFGWFWFGIWKIYRWYLFSIFDAWLELIFDWQWINELSIFGAFVADKSNQLECVKLWTPRTSLFQVRLIMSFSPTTSPSPSHLNYARTYLELFVYFESWLR